MEVIVFGHLGGNQRSGDLVPKIANYGHGIFGIFGVSRVHYQLILSKKRLSLQIWIMISPNLSLIVQIYQRTELD